MQTGTRQWVTKSCGQQRWYVFGLLSFHFRAHAPPLQIAGVQALHHMRIFHRDIKPENILITAEKHLVIGDYGIAHNWMDPFYANFPTSSLKARDAPGTMLYIAPEVVNGFYEDAENIAVRKYASCGLEADIWSLGVTICDTWRRGKPLFGIAEGEEDQNPDSAIPPKILYMDIGPAVKEIVDGHPIWHLITRVNTPSLS